MRAGLGGNDLIIMDVALSNNILPQRRNVIVGPNVGREKPVPFFGDDRIVFIDNIRSYVERLKEIWRPHNPNTVGQALVDIVKTSLYMAIQF
jgi:hypothetical protein